MTSEVASQGAVPGQASGGFSDTDVVSDADRYDLDAYRDIFRAAFPGLPRNFTADDVERRIDDAAPMVLRRVLVRGRARCGHGVRSGRFVQLSLWPVSGGAS